MRRLAGSGLLLIGLAACAGGAGGNGHPAETPRPSLPPSPSPSPSPWPSVAAGHRGASASTFAMDDLKALEARKEWRELVMHLDDVTPSKRDAVWETLVDEASLAFLTQLAQENDSFVGLSGGMQLVTRYPRLTRSSAFMEKLVAISKVALRECFAESYIGQHCLDAANELASAGAPNPRLIFEIGKVVRRGQNAQVAIPFFSKALDGHAPLEGACDDEDLKLSVLSALALPPGYENAELGRRVARGACSDKLRAPIEGALQGNSSYYAANACAVLKASSGRAKLPAICVEAR